MPVRLPIAMFYGPSDLYEYLKIDSLSEARQDDLQERVWQSHQLVTEIDSRSLKLGRLEGIQQVMYFPFDSHDLVAAMDSVVAKSES